MKIPTICDYCGGKVIFTDSAIVYHGKSYGNIYYCTNCGAYVGVHDGTKKPLGTLANAALRSKRREAHTFAPMEKKEREERRLPHRISLFCCFLLWLRFGCRGLNRVGVCRISIAINIHPFYGILLIHSVSNVLNVFFQQRLCPLLSTGQ